jgi:hypothetical protein
MFINYIILFSTGITYPGSGAVTGESSLINQADSKAAETAGISPSKQY